MSDAERAIGRLEGKMDLVLERVTSLESKVDSLKAWKWKTAGVLVTVFVAWSVVSQFI